MAIYKALMKTIGAIHIVDGILLPILWGGGLAFPGYYSAVAAPVWCGILFFIPAGILGIIAGNTGNRGVAIASLVLNVIGIVAAIIVIIFGAIITHADLTYLKYYYVGDVALDVIIILLALLELSLCIVGTVYSARITQKPTARQARTVVYSGGGVANPGMQNPGAQVQIQNPAQPVQGQYPGPAQGQYPGPPAQGQYPGPAQGQYPPPQEQKY
ncbi:uncharacterized protein LOC119732068 [Patiria miniata]|uniref:Uncharacterized protein n=1 Tax=Patiria miniata TaxID=46514 RepID=A0A914ABZ1_PATMI|nr:uncharacterized protein LOC119732068 [Patiria miniata]